VGDGSIQTVTSRDDLGRVYQTTETGDAAGCPWITTQGTQRIVPGSPSQPGFGYQVASNPYCSGTDPTMGWTLTESDTMGRVVNVTHYGGATIPSPGSPSSCSGAVCYTYGANTTGSTMAVTDEAGVSRAMTSDGLGRMTQVLDGTGVTTSYQYALSNLTSVSQSGQSRSFSYSSLNRLLSATNPESGTISYTYDPDGNLATRTDNRGTILCFGTLSGSTCSFSNYTGYNTLNQPLLKQYSDGTPNVAYTYGTATTHCPSSLYSVGRLCSVSNSVSTTAFAYNDQTGKVTASTQTTPTSGGTSYPFSYLYNLNDGLTQETYPSGRTVSCGYNSAGRVNQIVQGVPVRVNNNETHGVKV
jgi:YD repeat-containing protein